MLILNVCVYSYLNIFLNKIQSGNYVFFREITFFLRNYILFKDSRFLSIKHDFSRVHNPTIINLSAEIFLRSFKINSLELKNYRLELTYFWYLLIFLNLKCQKLIFSAKQKISKSLKILINFCSLTLLEFKFWGVGNVIPNKYEISREHVLRNTWFPLENKIYHNSMISQENYDFPIEHLYFLF